MRQLIFVLSLAVLGACSAFKDTNTVAKGGTKGKNIISRLLASNSHGNVAAKGLRELFIHSRIPEKKDIPLKKDIKCYVIPTLEYHSEHVMKFTPDEIKNVFHFIKKKRSIYNKGGGEYLPHRYVNHFTNRGMQGKFSVGEGGDEVKYTLTTRLQVTHRLHGNEDTKSLIVEEAFTYKGTTNKKASSVEYRYAPRSDIEEDYYVTSYMVCPLSLSLQ